MLILVDKTKAIGLQTYFLFSVTKIASQRNLDKSMLNKSIKDTIQNYSGLIVELKSNIPIDFILF
jgi:hypothetical protein|tara:strand:- start:283 stop:477 length:195 start_codon:yes stop_codon:yes gene_type:complete